MLLLGGKIKGNITDQTDLKNALDNKANTNDIPTKTSELQNDSNFINTNELNTALANKANTSDIPTKTSELQNDSNFVNTNELNTALANYQEKLVSGTNIKSINNESILGSGNIEISGIISSQKIDITLPANHTLIDNDSYLINNNLLLLNYNVWKDSGFTVATWNLIGTLPTNARPKKVMYGTAFICSNGWASPQATPVMILTDGKIEIYPQASNEKRALMSFLINIESV